MVVNFVLSPVYTFYLSPKEFGIIGQADLFSGFVSVFIALGVQQAVSRLFFDFARNLKLLNAFISTVLLMLIVLGISLFIFLSIFGDDLLNYFFSQNEFRFSNYGYLVFISAFSVVIQGVFVAWFRNSESIKKFAVATLLYFVIPAASILIGVVVLELGALGNIKGRAIGMSICTILILGWFAFSRPVKFEKRLVLKILSYGLPLVPYSLIIYFFNAMDRFMVERFFSIDDFGVYNFAYLLASLISVFLFALFNSISPKIYNGLKQVKHDSSEFRTYVDTQLLATIGFIALVIFGSQPVLLWFVDQAYLKSGEYLLILGLSYIPHVYYVVYSIPLFYYKQTRILPFTSAIALVIGGFVTYLLIQYFGIVGACMGAVAIKMVHLFVVVFATKKFGLFKNYSYISTRVLIVSVGVSLGVILGYCISLNSITPLWITNCIPLFIFIVLLFYLYPNLRSIESLKGAKNFMNFNFKS